MIVFYLRLEGEGLTRPHFATHFCLANLHALLATPPFLHARKTLRHIPLHPAGPDDGVGEVAGNEVPKLGFAEVETDGKTEEAAGIDGRTGFDEAAGIKLFDTDAGEEGA